MRETYVLTGLDQAPLDHLYITTIVLGPDGDLYSGEADRDLPNLVVGYRVVPSQPNAAAGA